MIAPVSKYLDWSVIQLAVTMMLPPANAQRARLEEALQFLKGPDFIPAESQPARVEFNPDKSGRTSAFPRHQTITLKDTWAKEVQKTYMRPRTEISPVQVGAIRRAMLAASNKSRFQRL